MEIEFNIECSAVNIKFFFAILEGKMRSTVILVVAVVLIVGQSLAESKRVHGLSNYVKNRPKPREIRGFKPEHMSTAIGFGKRHSSFEPPAERDDDGTFIPFVNISPERYYFRFKRLEDYGVFDK